VLLAAVACLLAYGVVVGRLAIPLSETSNVSTGGSPILKSTQAPHIPKAGSAPFGIATNFILPQGAGIFPKTHGLLVGSFRGSNRMPTKLNHEDVAAPQWLTSNL
jgi:hypothetical protein